MHRCALEMGHRQGLRDLIGSHHHGGDEDHHGETGAPLTGAGRRCARLGTQRRESPPLLQATQRRAYGSASSRALTIS